MTRYRNVITGMKYIDDIARMYGMDRRTALGRLTKANIKGVLVRRRAYYEMTKELDKVLSIPVKDHKPFKKKPAPVLSAQGYQIVNEDKDVCITVTA